MTHGSKGAVAAVPDRTIEQQIHVIRGCRVLLDADLADLYGVSTRVLNQAVKRNLSRFPGDFMFQLTVAEATNLMSQVVTSSSWGGRRKLPYAFTEQGVAMLSSVLRSERAIVVNIAIMRTFVRLRQVLETHHDLARRVDELESRYDGQFRVVFDALRQLIAPSASPARRIGFEGGATTDAD